MKEYQVKQLLLQHIEDRLNIFGISKAELTDEFDLVKSGLLDSMAFVDMIGRLEEGLGAQVDFEKVMEDEQFTTVAGVIGLFIKKSHG